MPSSLLRTRSDSSESDSTTNDSDEELLDGSLLSRNSETIANLYASARPRPPSVKRIAGDLSARASEKIGQALLDARRFLLLRRWSSLLEAVKNIETSLALGKSLEWRHPIIARLVRDASSEMQSALRNRRSLPADEAKALQALQQKLKRIRLDYSHFLGTSGTLVAEGSTSAAASAILNCLELGILSGEPCGICLDELGLRAVPSELERLPDFLQEYSLHSQQESIIPRITKLDLSDNPLANFPIGFSDSLPDLEELDIRRAGIKLLPPDIVRFRSLAAIHGQRPQLSNVRQLLGEALGHRDKAEPVASLVSLALHNLTPEQYAHLPPHLAILAEQSYVCASCSTRSFPLGSTFLSSSLVEPIYLFKRAVTVQVPLTPPNIAKLWIGGGAWRFCTDCLIEHVDGESCMCLVCRNRQNQLDAGKGIKWARPRLDPLSS